MLTEVVGAGGVRLSLRVAGAANASAIVFVHGWAQSSLAWSPQLADPGLSGRYRLVGMDLRGHGGSDVPALGYDDPRAWAEDLAAVIDFAGAGAPVLLVGWSYGGLVITDYLRVHGTTNVAGIVLAGAITEIGRGRPGGKTGPAMRGALPAALSDDPAEAVPALTALCAGMSSRPVDGPLAQSLLGTSLSVPPAVRAALFRRDVDSSVVLGGLDVPALVVHGVEDQVVDLSAGEYAAGKIAGARTRWMPGTGHLPFVEAAAEFNSALAQFAGERFAH
ncbi:alpha/beta fold hydrolase [Amycolatopsis sp. 195334CR]|uniref:alpha/beta fold hydrolase n=1 Tax=Amycolatopsis sp. 195334CR TaxID=2814588 RepID=UPI001A8C44E5|nr:alpha/beta hydrolase [Amycolatopsis sp. 195334CR]MBN6036087.1 alpha/beta hydrolase [Amycolatopsis sp. 195334CR]